MKLFLKILIVFIFLVVIIDNSSIFGQNKNKKQLQSEQQKIQEKIKYTKKLLDQTSNKKKSSLNQINLLEKQVNERKKLINSYTSEISIINQQVDATTTTIAGLEQEMQDLKTGYAKLVCQTYKTRSVYDKWMFLLASDDFYQAMRRLQYIKNYTTQREEKAQEILNAKMTLEENVVTLKDKKNERIGVITSKETEKQSLEKDRQAKEIGLSQLQKKEKELSKQLKNQQKELEKLNKEINKIIEKEITKKDKNNKILPLSPTEVKLSKDFTANMGNLPWPIERGTIVNHFGKHKHPNLNIYIECNGLDFLCEQGAAARAVFGGEVVKLINLPRYKAVVIKHGDYYTVYSKLSDISVTVNQIVTAKQKIGTIWTDPDSGETILYFELRKQTINQNPENWLIQR